MVDLRATTELFFFSELPGVLPMTKEINTGILAFLLS